VRVQYAPMLHTIGDLYRRLITATPLTLSCS